MLTCRAAAFTGGIIGPHHAASKAGLHGLTHFPASRPAATGATVNALAPALARRDQDAARRQTPDGIHHGARTSWPGSRRHRSAVIHDRYHHQDDDRYAAEAGVWAECGNT